MKSVYICFHMPAFAPFEVYSTGGAPPCVEWPAVCAKVYEADADAADAVAAEVARRAGVPLIISPVSAETPDSE